MKDVKPSASIVVPLVVRRAKGKKIRRERGFHLSQKMRGVTAYFLVVACVFGFLLSCNESTILVGCSDSMTPVIECDDEVRAMKVRNAQGVEAGDIVSFFADFVPTTRGYVALRNAQNHLVGDATIVLHRVVRVRETRSGERFYTTEGDANRIRDPGERFSHDIIDVVVSIKKAGSGDVLDREAIRSNWRNRLK